LISGIAAMVNTSNARGRPERGEGIGMKGS
jgi:hypothetical protein